jgi:glutamate formiminotransferase/glutamate formiminotransferase/formiminotetrahydrofolate cyclodeaminase
VWLDPRASMERAREIAAELRGPAVRTLALEAGGAPQVSCNLVDPTRVGPANVFDAVAQRAPVARAELVGLLPHEVLVVIPRERWSELDVDESKTIEARLKEAGLDGGSLPFG